LPCHAHAVAPAIRQRQVAEKANPHSGSRVLDTVLGVPGPAAAASSPGEGRRPAADGGRDDTTRRIGRQRPPMRTCRWLRPKPTLRVGSVTTLTVARASADTDQRRVLRLTPFDSGAALRARWRHLRRSAPAEVDTTSVPRGRLVRGYLQAWPRRRRVLPAPRPRYGQPASLLERSAADKSSEPVQLASHLLTPRVSARQALGGRV
jgi:hypothetical protein